MYVCRKNVTEHVTEWVKKKKENYSLRVVLKRKYHVDLLILWLPIDFSTNYLRLTDRKPLIGRIIALRTRKLRYRRLSSRPPMGKNKKFYEISKKIPWRDPLPLGGPVKQPSGRDWGFPIDMAAA